MINAVWITWENQRRNKTLSHALGVKLYQVEMDAHRLIRYPVLILKTIWILITSRVEIVFAQNPSIILASLAVVYGKLFNKKIIIDAHNAGVYPFDGRSKWADRVVRFIFKCSTLTIVTNDHLKQYVEKQGGRAFILPDPFPEIEALESKKLKGDLNFLLICTWAADEPYQEAIKAFSKLSNDSVLYITGNSKGREQKFGFELPDNVILTGYISDDEFDNLLHSCDCVIDLTTRENCLVCGAYEAVAVGKPLILSNTKALKTYFKEAAIYTDNNADAICDSVKIISNSLDQAIDRVKQYREQQQKDWMEMKNSLVYEISHNQKD